MNLEYRLADSTDLALLATPNAQLIEDEGHQNPLDLLGLEGRMAGWLRTTYRAAIVQENHSVVAYAHPT